MWGFFSIPYRWTLPLTLNTNYPLFTLEAVSPALTLSVSCPLLLNWHFNTLTHRFHKFFILKTNSCFVSTAKCDSQTWLITIYQFSTARYASCLWFMSLHLLQVKSIQDLLLQLSKLEFNNLLLNPKLPP
jgi:hypothetical protein